MLGLNTALPSLLGSGPPKWVLRGAGTPAKVDLDFAHGRYYGGTLATLLSTTSLSDAYATNSDGSLTWFIGARTNLAIQSVDLTNAAWSLTNATAPGGASDPSGGTTAVTLNDGVATGAHRIEGTAGIPFVSGTTYLLEVYAKKGNSNRVQLTFGTSNFSGAGYANFDLNAGTVVATGGTLVTSGIQAAANGFYRIYIAAVATATSSGSAELISLINADAAVRSVSYTGANNTVILYGPQVEAAQGGNPVVGPYIPTTTVAVTVQGQPRIGRGVGFQSDEEARTNLALQSQTYTNASWSKSHSGQATVSATTLTAPDGTATASTLLATAGSGFHYIGQGFTFTAAAYTYSFYVQRNNNDWIFFSVDDASLSYFNTATGVLGSLGSGTTATVTALANGWYRIAGTRTQTAVSTTGLGIGIAQANGTASYTASGTEAVNIWGSQLELASFPTSYIPTAAAAVTRNADNVQAGGALLAALKGSAGAALANVVSSPNADVNNPFILTSNDTTNASFLRPVSSSLIQSRMAGVSLNATIGGGSVSSNLKSAITWNASGRSLVANNGTVASDANFPGAITSVFVGSAAGSSAFVNGPISRLTVWNSRLPDATLKAMTA